MKFFYHFTEIYQSPKSIQDDSSTHQPNVVGKKKKKEFTDQLPEINFRTLSDIYIQVVTKVELAFPPSVKQMRRKRDDQ